MTPHFYIEGFVQLHEPVYMSGQPIKAILHYYKSNVHLFSKISKLDMDKLEPTVDLTKS